MSEEETVIVRRAELEELRSRLESLIAALSPSQNRGQARQSTPST